MIPGRRFEEYRSAEEFTAAARRGRESLALALLEDPIELSRAYAPWAFTVHLKDLIVKASEEGFHHLDVPLGDGVLDLPRIVGVLREAKLGIRFHLEVITREPHHVPCLTDAYWSTFGDVPARDLARTLGVVKSRPVERLPQFDQLPIQERIAREAEVVGRSLAFAREKLGL